MSNFWRLTEKFYIVPTGPDGSFPTEIELKVVISPGDYFGVADGGERTTVGDGETQFEINRAKARICIKDGTLPQLLKAQVCGDKWAIKLHGNEISLTGQVKSHQELQSALQKISLDLPRFFSVQACIYFEVASFSGTIWGRAIELHKMIENTTSLWANGSNESRTQALLGAVVGPLHETQSYARYELSSRYFYHALRLMSPSQINFSPNLTDGEVMLNLAKCLEIMFATDNRDAIKAQLARVSIDDDQFKSQVAPILLLRSKQDIAHPNSGLSTRHERSVMRDFVMRSVANVSAIMKMVENKIREDSNFLLPVENRSDELAKKVKDIQKYLALPGLDSGSAPISVKVDGHDTN